MLKAPLVLLLAAASLGGCSHARATEPGAGDPLHCLIAFEALSESASQQGQPEAARKFEERARWWADRLKVLPKEARSAEATDKAVAEFMALEDHGVALATDCLKAQEAERER